MAIDKACNNGWMRKLDTHMLEFMGGAINRNPIERVELPKGRQVRLGRWAIKIALLLQLWLYDLKAIQPDLDLEEGQLAEDHFRKLWQGHPQASTRVWVGMSPDFVSVPVTFSSMANWLPESTPSGIETLAPRGYHCAFNLRRVVFLVVGWDDGRKDAVADDVLDGAKRFPGKLQQVWPAMPERVEWPPERHLSGYEVADLIRPYTDWIRPRSKLVPMPEQP